jgi:hypothetical protein
MNDDCWFEVLSRVSVSDIKSIALTCKWLREMVQDEVFFARLLHVHFAEFKIEDALTQKSFFHEPRATERFNAENVSKKVFFQHLWRLKSRTLGFSGLFEANFGSHGKEYVYVKQTGFLLSGIKITGDPNVPRSKTTFQVNMDLYGYQFGQGKITLAKTGFQNPYFGRCEVLMTSPSSFLNVWIYTLDESIEYQSITPESLSRIPHHKFPTTYIRSRHSVGELEALIDGMEKDAVGNVDNDALEELLKGGEEEFDLDEDEDDVDAHAGFFLN